LVTSGRLSPARSGNEGLDRPGFDERPERRLGYPDVSSDPGEADTAFLDQATRKPLGSAQQGGDLGDGE
jgi:hypothetical protein